MPPTITLEKFLNEGNTVQIEDVSDSKSITLKAPHWHYPHHISTIGLGLEEEIKRFLSKNKGSVYNASDFQDEFNKKQKIIVENCMLDYQTLENHLLHLAFKGEIDMRILTSPYQVPNTEYFTAKTQS